MLWKTDVGNQRGVAHLRCTLRSDARRNAQLTYVCICSSAIQCASYSSQVPFNEGDLSCTRNIVYEKSVTYGIQQLITEPTGIISISFRTASLTDLIISSAKHLVLSSGVCNSNLSEHDIVHCQISCESRRSAYIFRFVFV